MKSEGIEISGEVIPLSYDESPPIATLADLQVAVAQLRVREQQLRMQNEELQQFQHNSRVAIERYKNLFELAPDPYLVTDSSGEIQEANAAASRLLNVPLDKLRGTSILKFITPGRRRAFRMGMKRIIAGHKPVSDMDEWAVPFKPRRGDPVEVSIAAAGVRETDGETTTVRWQLRDVTSRRLAEAELRTQRAELEQRLLEQSAALEAANWAKAEFLSVMAHELRTPLNAIIGYAELLEMGISGPVSEGQMAHLDRIRVSGKRLVSLVNEVLDLGKAEAGQLRVLREECLVSDAVQAAISLLMPQAAERAIKLNNECGPGLSIQYIGDSSRVEQILINLLSNAIKFTDPGGKVTISASREVRNSLVDREFDAKHIWVALRVRDTGIGMSADSIAKVFEPFVQVEDPLTRTRGGTGLGLTISRRLARLMGGDLMVESVHGEGSTFTLWLPAAGSFTAETPEELERRAPARYAQGLAQLGTNLLEEVEGIVKTYARRLRAKGGIPRARKLSKSVLEDHAAAFLADIFQALVAVEDAQGGPSGVMRDGSVLRRIISERHGAQRQRLGWTEEELRSEFRILHRCVDDAARKLASQERDVHAGTALKAARTVLGRLLDTAEEISLRGFRLAGIDNFQNIHPAS
jgi:PAS domain S-box-containing protein